jgi:hypothetical protein
MAEIRNVSMVVEASTDPTASDWNYVIGTRWLNQSSTLTYEILDNTFNAAVWKLIPDFTSGVFVPMLSFGGGSTGITYSTQTGFFQKVSSIIFISIILQLTSKGSSTGDATIEGLPFNGASDVGLNILKNNITLAASTPILKALLSAGTQTISILQEGAILSSTTVTDSEFANDSGLTISGTYFT